MASIKASLVEGTRRFDFRDLLTAALRLG